MPYDALKDRQKARRELIAINALVTRNLIELIEENPNELAEVERVIATSDDPARALKQRFSNQINDSLRRSRLSLDRIRVNQFLATAIDFVNWDTVVESFV